MNWYKRLFTRIGLASETKQLGKVDTKPTEIKHGASYISNGGRSAYSQLGSLGAYVQHPYVYAALSRISQDLASTPLMLIKGKGKNSKIIEDHPVLELLEEPSTGIDQFSFLEQLIIDLVAAGNAFILILGETETPISIVRLHPEQVGIVTNVTGVVGYRFDADGQSILYTPDRVIHIKNASWATGVQGLYGVGAVQPTQQEIKADLNVSSLVEIASKKGRPDVILSPKNELDVWQEETRRDVLDRYNGMIEDGGAIVLSGQVQVDVANTSPRDVEFAKVKEFSKLAITAAFGTPLSILGEGSANFATARQEAIIHWSNVEKRGKKIGWALTKIARRFDSTLRFEFDYSGVEALNAMRSEQIERVTAHIMNGMEAGAAYAFEGLGEAPIGSNEQRTEPVETPALEEEEQVASLASWIERSYSNEDDDDSTEEVEKTAEKEEHSVDKSFDKIIEEILDGMYTKKGSVGDELEEQKRMKRKALWNYYIKAKADPAERMIQKSTRQYLLDASRRYKKRIRKNVVKGTKGIVDLGELQGMEEESRQIFNTIGGAFQRVWRLNGDSTLDQIFQMAGIPKPLDLNFGSQELLIELSEEMSKQISRTTANAVTKSIQNSLINGESITQIADNIDKIAAFGVGRSMTIARTEATKALNRSAVEGYRQASQETGLKIEKEWLAVQDGNTRPSHGDLDGVTVGIDDLFETDGYTALSPGDFGEAEQDCNCRCTVIPVVK